MLRALQLCRLPRHSKCQLLIRTRYHTEHGVYGYRPQPQRNPFQEPESFIRNRYENANLFRLVTAYREFGHRKADIDPLKLQTLSAPEELDPARYGLSAASQEQFNLEGILNVGLGKADLKTVIDHLEHLYCGTTSVEFSHLLTLEERSWFASKYEEIKSVTLTDSDKIALAKLMLKSQTFDHFLANKFTTVKRYGGEGAEAAMGFYQELFRLAPKYDISDVIVCIAHRGRLNLLTCLLEFPPVVMFRKMQGKREFPPDVTGVGDVLSHLTSSVDLQFNGDKVHVTMVPNPSHLEAVNPVAVGKTRGRQQTHRAAEYAKEGEMARVGDKALCLQLHGDGAFAGQGIVAETFTLASVPHFNVGGSVHLIINNQLGFTTEASRGRSAMYSSCVAKMNGCPVIHVNGDHPEEIIKACRLAMEYRNEFRKDVIVDLLCFRKYGHNELDDPSFTQPVMYDVIKKRKMVPNEYAAKLVESGICTQEELNEVVTSYTQELNKNLSEVDSHVPKANHLEKQWSGYIQAPNCISAWETGLPIDTLKFIGAKSVTVPDDFDTHPTLKKTHVDRRLGKLKEGKDLDWATSEALAFGSLLYQDKAAANMTLVELHGSAGQAENLFAEDRHVHFMSDPPHLLKTLRNNLSNSGSAKRSRYLWNNGHHLLWQHIRDVYEKDSARELKKTKLTKDHIYFTSYSAMNVRLAAEVLSDSVYRYLLAYGGEETAETAKFVHICDKFFDCLNVRSNFEGERKRKSDLMPYTSTDDPRFQYLQEVVEFFREWESNVEAREGFNKAEKQKMFISLPTYKGVVTTVESTTQAVKYLLGEGVTPVYTNRFCQDPLEAHFGKHRTMGRRSENPTLYTYGYQDTKLRIQKSVSEALRPRGNVAATYEEIEINDQPLKKRRKESMT